MAQTFQIVVPGQHFAFYPESQFVCSVSAFVVDPSVHLRRQVLLPTIAMLMRCRVII